MKIALLGAGRIGQLHGRLVASQPEVTEVIVFDIDPRRAREAADAIGGRIANRPEEALDAADTAIVTATTDAHPSLVSMAIDRRMPVFCEKPLALELDVTNELVERIERTSAMVQIGFQRRFDPAYVEARRLVSTGELGTVYLVRLIAHDHEPPPDGYIPVRGDCSAIPRSMISTHCAG